MVWEGSRKGFLGGFMPKQSYTPCPPSHLPVRDTSYTVIVTQ